MFNGNGYQVNGYNENDVQRLSNIGEGEDPIAQAMGLQQQQQPQQYTQTGLPGKSLEKLNGHATNHLQYLQQSQPVQQINANGRAISIAISPDGTITIIVN